MNTQKAPECNIMQGGRWCVLKSGGNSIMVPLRFLSLSSFASCCRSACSLRSVRSFRSAPFAPFRSLRSFRSVPFASFLSLRPTCRYAFPRSRSLSAAFPTSLLCVAFLSVFSFPRCTMIEFPELKAPPPPLHYVTLWSLLSFMQIEFKKRQVVIWLSHTTVA